MDVPSVVWGLTIASIVGLSAFDFVFHVRKAHTPTLREAALWSGLYVGLALLFGVGVLVFGGSQAGSEYFAGYVTEKALSVDNLFVFLIIPAGRRYLLRRVFVGWESPTPIPDHNTSSV